jgi:hypothetical protein
MKILSFIFILMLLPCLIFSQKMAIFPLEDISPTKYSQLTSQIITSKIINSFKSFNRFSIIEQEKLPEVLSANLRTNAQIDAQILSQIDADFVCFGTYNCDVSSYSTYIPDLRKYHIKAISTITISLRIVAVKVATIIVTEAATTSENFEGRSSVPTIKLNEHIFSRIYDRAIPEVVNKIVPKIPNTPPQPVVTQPTKPSQGNNSSTTPNPKGDVAIVVGMGYNDKYDIAKELALKDAFRMAIEKVAGVYLQSESEMKDFELVKDQIFTESKGIVSNYKILSETKNPTDPSEITLKVECTVSWAALKERWQTIRSVLKDKNYPRLLIQTKITFGGMDAKDFNKDTLQLSMERVFASVGFPIVSLGGVNEEDPNAVHELAKNNRVELLLLFNFKPTMESQYALGTTIKTHTLITIVQGSISQMMYTSKSMGSEVKRQVASLPKTYTFSGINPTITMAEGLMDAGERYAKDLITEILNQSWDIQAQEGVPVIVKVEKISYSQLRNLKSALEKVSGIKKLMQRGYRDKIVEFELMTSLSSDKLVDLVFDTAEKIGLNLDVKDTSDTEILMEVLGY